MKDVIFISVFLLFVVLLIAGCEKGTILDDTERVVPHMDRWGIYSLEIESGDVELLLSSPNELSGLSLSFDGQSFVFAQKLDGMGDNHYEICVLELGTSVYERLTHNDYMDVYPCWSPTDNQIAYLSWPALNLDIYMMDSNGNNPNLLYNSGGHDADIDWVGNYIVYTQESQIWVINDDGSEPTRVTDPPNAGQCGNANLPFGDYDPRLNPNATRILFERLEDDISPHGNYNIYICNVDGSGLIQLTTTGYSQGLAEWSHDGYKIAYLVAAIGEQGVYDIYMMYLDGSNNHNITPGYFPPEFLCHNPVFSLDDTRIYFIGEWWE